MGGLHAGHESLIRRSARENSATIVSIFVNPLQFGPKEDFAKYPRTIESDLSICERAGGTAVFVGETADLYPEGHCIRVDPGPLGDVLCGATRPGHFRGVATVVAKLFGIVEPNVAYFGLKDFQQFAVIRRLVADLNMPLTVIGCETIREPDGLAMSTRNRYLSPTDRERATCLWRGLTAARRLFAAGERSADKLENAAISEVAGTPGAAIDYITVVEPRTLLRAAEAAEGSVLCMAVFLGGARLIDNGALSSLGQ